MMCRCLLHMTLLVNRALSSIQPNRIGDAHDVEDGLLADLTVASH